MKRQIIGTIILIALILSLSTINSFAAGSFSVTSSRSLTEGGTSSITISANGCGGKFTISSSNSSVVSVSSSSMWVESGSSSVTITAKKAGTATITVTASDVASTDGSTEITGSKTCTVTVKAKAASNSGSSSSGGGSSSGGSSGGYTQKPTTTNPKEIEKSKVNTLSGLSVAEGTITPEFNKDVREYSLNIPYETSSVNVTATPTDSKATVDVTGNTDLKEGENTVTVTVTAEDGSTSKYLIRVIRARVPLALRSLIVKYTNENGELIELPLNPTFSFDTLEYTLEDLEYWVEKLLIQATANIEGATIDIHGADNLSTGENIIIIALNIKEGEGEELKEETISYTIKVNKKEEPTLLAKISNWFKGIFGGVSSWYNENQEQIILGALGICIIALLGLSIYIVVDYNKYKDVIAKLKKVNEINENQNIAEEIYQKNNPEILENLGKKSDNDDNAKGGKHF